jgi:hypothetical protein
LSEVGPGYRDVTPEEIARYREFGWVKLQKFVPIAQVDALLAIAKERMGEDGDRNAPPKSFPILCNPLRHRPAVYRWQRGRCSPFFALGRPPISL